MDKILTNRFIKKGAMNNIDFSILLNDYKTILNGIYITIIVSLISSLFALCIGTLFAYYRTSPVKMTQITANFIANCTRNTPLLIIIYLFYKGLPSIGIMLPAMACGISALSIYSGAYISDAILSGMNAVPNEHSQAATALGLTRFQTFFYVTYPQALRYSINILGSQFMNLIKNSSLVSFITVTDIFYVAYKGIADNFRVYEYFILAIIVYCSLTGFTLLITNILQKIYKIPTIEVRA